MSDLTKSELLGMSNGHISAEENSNRENSSTELLEREPIEGSPFYIIGNNVDGYFVAFGKYRLTIPKNTKEEVHVDLVVNFWNVVSNLILVMMELKDDAIGNVKNEL